VPAARPRPGRGARWRQGPGAAGAVLDDGISYVESERGRRCRPKAVLTCEDSHITRILWTATKEHSTEPGHRSGAVEQVGGEEVQRQDALRLGPQELDPARAIPAGHRIDPGALEDLPDRGRRDRDAQSGKHAVDPPVALGLVLPRQPQHHRPHIAVHRRTPGAATVRHTRPPAAHDVTVPSHDRAESDDQPHRGEAAGGQRPGQQRRPRPVRPRQTRMSARPLALGDSELMAQHQDLRVLPPRLPPRQAQHRHRTGHDQENQLQAHMPKIIPSPDGPIPAHPAPERGTEPSATCRASAQVAQVFGTHSPAGPDRRPAATGPHCRSA
jgi:hypothetical protein